MFATLMNGIEHSLLGPVVTELKQMTPSPICESFEKESRIKALKRMKEIRSLMNVVVPPTSQPQG